MPVTDMPMTIETPRGPVRITSTEEHWGTAFTLAHARSGELIGEKLAAPDAVMMLLEMRYGTKPQDADFMPHKPGLTVVGWVKGRTVWYPVTIDGEILAVDTLCMGQFDFPGLLRQLIQLRHLKLVTD